MFGLNNLITNLYTGGIAITGVVLGYASVVGVRKAHPYIVDRRHYKELLVEVKAIHLRLRKVPAYDYMVHAERSEMLFSFAYRMMIRQHQLRPFSYLSYMIEYLEEDVPLIAME